MSEKRKHTEPELVKVQTRCVCGDIWDVWINLATDLTTVHDVCYICGAVWSHQDILDDGYVYPESEVD